MDNPGKVANPARGQLNRENNIPLSPCVPENLVSRDGFSRPVPRQPAHLHTQAESGAYLRDSSQVPRRRPFMKPPHAIGSVPSLSGHAIAYRWRSLPRVRRHRASKPQGSSERVLPWQITMDQLIFASLSPTHYWCNLINKHTQTHTHTTPVVPQVKFREAVIVRIIHVVPKGETPVQVSLPPTFRGITQTEPFQLEVHNRFSSLEHSAKIRFAVCSRT